MPRAEVGTPKYIANKMKAKGLQKLRWYCQMCQKQCRDENGFKCHTSSESHQRQLLLFADNPGKYLYSFSQEFEEGYMDLLRRRFGTKRVLANMVYQEYITDRHHIHMNATHWHSLTGFVKAMGRQGKLVVDETEKGWYITYVDRRPETILREKELERKKKYAKDAEERMQEFFERQVELGKEKEKERGESSVKTELMRDDPEEKITLDLQIKAVKSAFIPIKNEAFKKPETKIEIFKKPDAKGQKRKASALDEIMKEREKIKERENRKENWIAENIVVKVITKALGDKYYKQKAVIKQVHSEFIAVVKMLDSGHTLKLDQEHLETVIPSTGRKILIVNGAYRGCVAVLKSLNEQQSSVTVEIVEGPAHGRLLKNISYDDISKLYIPP